MTCPALNWGPFLVSWSPGSEYSHSTYYGVPDPGLDPGHTDASNPPCFFLWSNWDPEDGSLPTLPF